MQATATVQNAMASATKVMALRGPSSKNNYSQILQVMTATNKQMDVGKMQATMQQFERQQEIASMSEEYAFYFRRPRTTLTYFVRMLDDMLNDELDDEESDEVLDKVFDEIGLDLAGTVRTLPT
jgi:charged multivesicular body protein 2A